MFTVQLIHDQGVAREWQCDTAADALPHVAFLLGAMSEGDSIIVNNGDPGYLPEETGVQD
jgi:hypothetical protein